MTKKIALLVGLAAIVGVLAIKTMTMATTMGTLHCIYAGKKNCETPPRPVEPIPENNNKNQG